MGAVVACLLFVAPRFVTTVLAAEPLPAEGPFRLEAEATLGAPARAVAINADESLLAAATGEGDTVPVTILDRRSRATLGSVNTQAGAEPRLVFAPNQDLLLVWGKSALELWNVSASALSADKPLPEDHRLWRQPLTGEEPVTQAGFAGAPLSVLWTRGGSLFGRGIAADSAAAAPTVAVAAADRALLTANGALKGFAASTGDSVLLLFSAGKELQRYAHVPSEARPAGVPDVLKGHRFPVSSAQVLTDRSLLSLDAGRNLIAWNDAGQLGRIDFLKALPEDAQPERLWALKPDKLLILVHQGAEWRLAAWDGSARKVLGALTVPAPPRVAVSPTGHYVITGVDTALRVYQSSLSLSPVEYVRQLREQDAVQTALSYARLLDPDTLSLAMKRQVEQDLSRVPSERVLAELVDRMREAVQAGDAAAIQQWAEQVLSRQPGHPEALAALARVEELRDRAVLGEARKAFEEGHYRSAIEILASRISPASAVFPEAGELIKESEKRRDIENTLTQARQKMELELFPAAETLVNEALRRDPENREALLLSTEIRTRSGGFMREALALLIGIVAAGGIVAMFLFRYREAWRKLLRPLSIQHEAAQPMPGERPQARAHARSEPHAQPHGPLHGGAREAPRGAAPSGRTAADPRGAKFRLDQATKLEETRGEMRKAEEMLRLTRRRDRFQEHTAWFLELEAELNTLQRRLNDPSADPDRILPRLRKIMGDLREVKFNAGGPARSNAGANGEEQDYYQILHVSNGASEADIKAAYHKLVKQYHPDRHSGSEFAWIKEESERMTRKLGEAYQVLSDTGRREQYDRELARRRRAGA